MKTEILNKTNKNVVNFCDFRRKKQTEDFFSRGREPLYLSHGRGQINGKKTDSNTNDKLSDFSERISKMRQNVELIEKILGKDKN